jgi:replicative DNA helicase
MEKSKTLPFDEQVERAVLGAILKNNDSLAEISLLLKADAFHILKNKHIYQAMLECMQVRKNIDEVTIADILKKKNILEDCGKMIYLVELSESAPAPENVKFYTNILKEHYLSREVIRISAEISKNVQSEGQNIDEVLANAQKQIEEIAKQKVEKSYHLLSEVTQSAKIDIEELANQGAGLTGVSSGFRFLDQITAGLQTSDLIVVAARPSAGKTAFSLNIAYHVAAKEQKGVIFFSLEMSKEQIAKRILSSYAEINNKNIRTGKMSPEEQQRLNAEVKATANVPFYICDKPGLNSFELQALCKQMYHDLKGNLGLIVVDYLQLMGAANRYNNRQEEITEISRNLKLIAKELNVPVIANAQLNRDLEKRKDKRPILSDLRDSGTIEQDADIVMFIYRDVLYNKDALNPNVSEIIVSKYRNGETGVYRLFFKGEYTRFFNLSPEQEIQFAQEDLNQTDIPI